MLEKAESIKTYGPINYSDIVNADESQIERRIEVEAKRLSEKFIANFFHKYGTQLSEFLLSLKNESDFLAETETLEIISQREYTDKEIRQAVNDTITQVKNYLDYRGIKISSLDNFLKNLMRK